MNLNRLKIRAQTYSVWVLVNFVVCMLPLLALYFIKYHPSQSTPHNDIFSSFLAYVFTLLIISLYEKLEFKESSNSITVWVTILAFVVVGGLYIFYNLTNPISNHVNSHLKNYFVSIFALTFFLSLFLNIKNLEDKVHKKYYDLIFTKEDGSQNLDRDQI